MTTGTRRLSYVVPVIAACSVVEAKDLWPPSAPSGSEYWWVVLLLSKARLATTCPLKHQGNGSKLQADDENLGFDVRRAVSGAMAGRMVDLVRNLCVLNMGIHPVSTVKQPLSRSRRSRRSLSQVAVSERNGEASFVIPFYRFGCWLLGLDEVTINNAEKRVIVSTLHAATTCCCLPPPLCFKARVVAVSGKASVAPRMPQTMDYLGAAWGGQTLTLWIHLSVFYSRVSFWCAFQGFPPNAPMLLRCLPTVEKMV